jgi:S1-C subfamily serine protease
MLLGKTQSEVKPRGFLGVELADSSGVVTVASVLANSPAAHAGLRKDDRITLIQEMPVKTSADVLRLSASLAVGETVKLTVQRGRTTETIVVKLGGGL